jgi:Zn-dependent protease
MSAAMTSTCPQCATQFGPDMTVCPGCGRLLHTDQLNALAQAAREATATGDLSTALANWREALALLPTNSRQYEVVSAKIAELGQHVSSGALPQKQSTNKASPALRAATGAGAVGLMLWKLKALLFGLTKGTTFLTMLLSLGVYWSMWGWKFALGLVLSIYVHEMGHVITLRRYGFKATAPMFIPGIGALIRLQQQVTNPREDADIGLAGPIYGLGAAAVSFGLWLATNEPIFAAIAGVGAWINLFNLLPIGPLDGGRAFHALSRLQKLLAVAAVGGAIYITSDDPIHGLLHGLLIVLGLVCVARALGDKSDQEGNWNVAVTYASLVLALVALCILGKQAGAGG